MTRRATDRAAPGTIWSALRRPGWAPGSRPGLGSAGLAASGTAPAATVLALAVVTGGLVVRFPAAAPVPLVLVGAAAAAAARPAARADVVRGAAAAVLLLAVLNGIPGVDLSGQPVRGGIRFQDYAVGLLVILLVVWRGQDGAGPRGSPTRQWLTAWCVVFGGWWTVTLVRTAAGSGVPVRLGGQYGRDFLYFALLVPLLLRIRLSGASVRAFAGVMVAAVWVFAAAEIVSALQIADLSGITHSSMTAPTGGVLRVYATMNDLVTVGLAVGLGVLLVAPEPEVCRRAAPVFSVCLVAFVLQLTRASYVGVFVSGGIVIGWWMINASGGWRERVRRRALAATVGGAIVLGAGLLVVPGTADNPAVGAVAGRVTSGIAEVNSSTGTVGYRRGVYRTMIELLGGEWPVGLGFLHPSARYFADLPSGSIRNTDTGVLNILMTMGAIGVAVFLAGPVLLLARLFAAAGDLRRGATPAAAVVFGATLWLLAAVLTSVTLVTLFSVSGLVLTAFVVRAAVAAAEGELA